MACLNCGEHDRVDIVNSMTALDDKLIPDPNVTIEQALEDVFGCTRMMLSSKCPSTLHGHTPILCSCCTQLLTMSHQFRSEFLGRGNNNELFAQWRKKRAVEDSFYNLLMSIDSPISDLPDSNFHDTIEDVQNSEACDYSFMLDNILTDLDSETGNLNVTLDHVDEDDEIPPTETQPVPYFETVEISICDKDNNSDLNSKEKPSPNFREAKVPEKRRHEVSCNICQKLTLPKEKVSKRNQNKYCQCPNTVLDHYIINELDLSSSCGVDDEDDLLDLDIYDDEESQQKLSRIELPSKESFSCTKETCKEKFPFQALLLTHILIRHSENEIRVPRRIGGRNKNQIQYFCTLCKYKTHTSSNMEDHYFRHTKERRFKCSVPNCHFTTGTKIAFSDHEKRGKHGRSKVNASVNFVQKVMPTDRLHRCQHCQMTFGFQADLLCHVQAVHKKSKDGGFPCNLCEYNAKFKHALRNHYFEKHTNEHLFKCTFPTCSYVTFEKRRIMEHALSHGEKNFKCTYCDKLSATQTKNKRHEKTHLKK